MSREAARDGFEPTSGEVDILGVPESAGRKWKREGAAKPEMQGGVLLTHSLCQQATRVVENNVY